MLRPKSELLQRFIDGRNNRNIGATFTRLAATFATLPLGDVACCALRFVAEFQIRKDDRIEA
jgi:hypothetical protein